MRILSALFGLAFGLIFTSVGVFIAQETAVPTYQSWQNMRTWQPTTGTLLAVSGSENDTAARYRYDVAGVEYQNDSVYVASFKDNIGSYHQDLYRKLRRLNDNNQPVTIWYNPENPEESVIDRNMRWGLFTLISGFCGVFILAGLSICYASLRGKSAEANTAPTPSLSALRSEWSQTKSRTNENFFEFMLKKGAMPELQAVAQTGLDSRVSVNRMPWLDRKEWRNNRIRSNAKLGLYVMWGFAIVWCGVSSPLLFVLGDEIRQENYAVLFGLLFPLIGIVLLFIAGKMTRAWLRFGVIELELDPFPGSIGGHVGGSLILTKGAGTRSPYTVELECVHSYVSGSGDDRSSREDIRWAERGFAKAEMTGRGVRLEFRFDVPDELPESDIDQSGTYNFWRLRLSGESDGIKLKREYNIPVFKTQTLSKYIRHDNSAQAAELQKERALISAAAIGRGDFANTALARAVRYKDTGQEQLFYYPMFRNKLLTLFALIFAGGFDFAAFSINQNFEGNFFMGIGLLLFSLPFALVGLIASIALIYLPFNNLSITLAARKITALRRILFFPILYHSIQGRDIQNIEIKSTGSTGSGTSQIKHFKLIVHGRRGEKFTIAEDIDGEVLAGQLKEFIEKRLAIAA